MRVGSRSDKISIPLKRERETVPHPPITSLACEDTTRRHPAANSEDSVTRV